MRQHYPIFFPHSTLINAQHNYALSIMHFCFATSGGVEIESSFNALWAPHTTLRVTYALKSPRAKG